MPDFTQLIEQSFYPQIKTFLAQHPEGIAEHEFIRHLVEQGVLQALDTAVSPSLLLFQKHFLMFHALYSISQQMVANKQGAIGESKSIIDAEIISMVLCDVAGNDMDFGAWLVQDHLKSIAQGSGCTRVQKLLASTGSGSTRHAIFHEHRGPVKLPVAFAGPEISEWSAGVEAYLTYPLGRPVTATRLWPAPDKACNNV